MIGEALRSNRVIQAINFDPKLLIIPALVCCWLLPFITFSSPDDWRSGRVDIAPILPPFVFKVIKFFGRSGAIVLLSFCLLSVWQYERRRYVIAILSPLIAFGFFGVLSTAWSALKFISLQQSLTFILLMLLASYIGTVWRSDRDTEKIVKHLSLAIFALSTTLLLFRFGMPISGALTKDASGVLHSTNAGAAGGLGILLTLSARLLWRSAWTVWWFPIVLTEVTMMLVGGNRLSVAVTLVAAFLLFLLALHRGLAGFLVLAGSILIGGYVIADPSFSLAERVSKNAGVYAKQGQSKSEIGSLSGRAEMWDKMWKSYRESPIIGHGYFVTTAKGEIHVWHRSGNWTAHNMALQILVTTGVVGLLLISVGLLSLAMGVFAGLRSLPDLENSITLLFVFSVWYFGWGFLNSSFIGPLQPESVVFAALAGIAAGIGGTAHWAADTRDPEILRSTLVVD